MRPPRQHETSLAEATRAPDRRHFDPYTEICRIARAAAPRHAADCCRNAADFAHDAWLSLAARQKDISKLTREQLREGVVAIIWGTTRACPKPDRNPPRDLDKLPAAEGRDDLLAVDEAVERLRTDEPELAALVTLRFFDGLPLKRAARAMHVTERLARNYWIRARTQLRRMLSDPVLPAHA
jgi:DNA-directed RNA polymerase specialized sigma24 family protein